MRKISRIESFGSDYQIAYPSFMASTVWGAVLTGAVIGGSLALSCVAPMCALAVALGATLGLRASLLTMTLVWLVNQAIGFTLFHFPRTANSFWWGVAIGLAALLITVVAHGAIRRMSSSKAAVRLSVAFVLTLVVYEAGLWIAALVLGGRDMFTLPIVAQVALINSAWLFAIVGLNEIVAVLCKPWVGRIPMMLRWPGLT
ncbi:MAG TPA: hypothetical protein VJS88_01545 [Chthoniobacterales bacterium]|nr:hypothetical protein [Chthoniobacterales bacterium]